MIVNVSWYELSFYIVIYSMKANIQFLAVSDWKLVINSMINDKNGEEGDSGRVV